MKLSHAPSREGKTPTSAFSPLPKGGA
jgi:hypothetical protein